MAFRRPKDNTCQRAQKWSAWIEQHCATLRSLGLPPIVYLDSDHWLDFLDNGSLDHHPDPSHFEIAQLSAGQLHALRRFLEQQYANEEPCPSLIRMLRVRCES